MAMLLITHNLAIAASLAQRIVVMYAGQVVEAGPSRAIIAAPRHPYTKALLHAVPKLRGGERLEGIPGQIPSGQAWPTGCRFHPRCPIVREKCRQNAPELVTVADPGTQRQTRCFFPEEVDQA
jgi:oligopeptide/dipeptide ABC transporter ATP-binding protein